MNYSKYIDPKKNSLPQTVSFSKRVKMYKQDRYGGLYSLNVTMIANAKLTLGDPVLKKISNKNETDCVRLVVPIFSVGGVFWLLVDDIGREHFDELQLRSAEVQPIVKV